MRPRRPGRTKTCSVMGRPLRLLFLATAFFLFLTTTAQGQSPKPEGLKSDVELTPSPFFGPQIHKIPMAIPEFLDESDDRDGDLSRKLAETITSDMEMSGEFEVIDRGRYLEDPRTSGVKLGSFAIEDWSMIGAEYLVKGAFRREGEKITVTLRLFNASKKTLVLGKEYRGAYHERYKIVHMFSNEIFMALFGERGFFGTRVAFVSGSMSRREIYLMDIDGRNRRKLTNLGLLVMSPKWSPDGKKIIFAALGDNVPSGIYTVDVKSGKVRKVISVEDGVALTPSFSPSGTRIVAALSMEGNTEIYEMGLDGSDLRNLTKYWSIEMSPAYSPDGQKMLMISDRTGAPQVYKMGADGSEPERISYFGSYNQTPTWSPRGDKIAYSSREFGHYTIYLIDEFGGEPYALTADLGVNCEYATFSPDGRALFFSCQTAMGRALWMRTTNDSYTKKITKGTTLDIYPAWEPMPSR